MSSIDKVVVVTGANTGIGAAFAKEIARPGVHLVLACRSEGKTAPVLRELREKGAEASFVPLDLDRMARAHEAGERIAKEHPRVDWLVNNAGVAGARGLTEDGYEVAFGTNHLGHFAFTMPLLGAVLAAKGRVVNVSSGNHFQPRSLDLTRVTQPTSSRTGLDEYGVSKLANVLFTAELRRRYPGLDAVAMNPGRIASDIWRKVPSPVRAVLPWLLRMGSVEAGGHTIAHAATASLEGDILYFHKLGPKEPSPLSRDAALAERLWTFSEHALESARESAVRGAA